MNQVLVDLGCVIFLTQLYNSTIWYLSIYVLLWQYDHEEAHSWDCSVLHHLLQTTFLILWYSSCSLWTCSECYNFVFNVTASKGDCLKLYDTHLQSHCMQFKHSSSFILFFLYKIWHLVKYLHLILLTIINRLSCVINLFSIWQSTENFVQNIEVIVMLEMLDWGQFCKGFDNHLLTYK